MNRHLSDGDFGYDQVTRLVGQGMDFIMGGGKIVHLVPTHKQSRVVFHLMMVEENGQENDISTYSPWWW